MKYTHIVFDIDGTLLDTEDAVLSSLQALIMEFQKHEVDASQLKFSLGIPGQDALVRLGFSDPTHGNKRWAELFQQYLGKVRVFDGIKETLIKLRKQGYSLGIITSETGEEYKTNFVPFTLAGYFDVVICAEDTQKHKPNPEPMKKYLERTLSAPNEVLYVGDTRYDLQCSEGAGTDFALALWGCWDSEDIHAQKRIKKPEDIFRLL